VPALNEEDNIRAAVESIIADCGKAGVDWEVVVVDDGSTDSTGRIVDELARRHAPRIKVLHHKRPMGVGASIRDAVGATSKDAVTWLPGDGENEPYEIIKYLPLLEHVDFIVPFVVNNHIRTLSRRILSRLFVNIINMTFGTFMSYTNGNVIYKRMIFDSIRQESNGFFFQTECVVKSARAGYNFAEVPIRLRGRRKGKSKALTLKSLKVVVSEYLRLIWMVYFKRDRNLRK
jgi:glycosyltransferase involved in cell wall biosynthesis